MKKKESFDESYDNEQKEIENFKSQIDELQKQIEYLKNLVQTQQGTIINQQQQQASKEYLVISMFEPNFLNILFAFAIHQFDF